MPTPEELAKQAADQYMASQAADQYLQKSDGTYNELNKSPETISESQFKPATSEDLPKEVPGFMKSVEMIGTGAMMGSLTFTSNLMSLVAPDAVKRANEYWSQKMQENAAKYNGAGFLQGLGKVTAETVDTLPIFKGAALLGRGLEAVGSAMQGTKGLNLLGKGIEAVGQGPQAVGDLMPSGLKTVGKYGTSAATGAGTIAAMESQRYDPNKPTQLFNSEAAGEALSNPYAYIAPMAGTKAATYLDATQRLGAARDIIPSTTASQIKPAGPSRTLAFETFAAPAALTGTGHYIQQQREIGNDLKNFVTTIAGSKEAQGASYLDLLDMSGKKVTAALDNMKKAENNLWNQGGFKTAPIKTEDYINVQDLANQAKNILTDSAIPGHSNAVKLIDENLKKMGSDTGSLSAIGMGSNKAGLTVDDVKNLQNTIGNAVSDAYAVEGGTGAQMGRDLASIRNNLIDPIQNAIPESAMKDFMAAREFTARKHALFDVAPLLPKAIGDETNAQKLVTNLLSEGGVLPPKRAAVSTLNEFNPGSMQTVEAAKIAQILEKADKGNGKFNVDEFLGGIKDTSQFSHIASSDTVKAIEGLKPIMQAISESSKVGWWRQAAVLGGVGAATGGMTLGPMGIAAPLVSYAAASFIANKSPIKTLLLSGSKFMNMSPNTQQAIIKAVNNHLGRAGFLFTQDGLQHKDEANQ